MNSDNDTNSRIKNVLNGQKKPKFIILGGCLLLCCSCCFLGLLISYFSPPKLQLLSNDNDKEISEPQYLIYLDCTGISQLKINSKELSSIERNNACSRTGYKVDLVNGDNTFNLEGISMRGEKVDLSFIVKFDEAKYQELQAQKERERLEAEQKQKQIDEENQRKQQEEANKPRKPQVGDVMAGIGIREIKQEYDKQKAISNAKAQLYLDTLKGQHIVWIGEVSNVDQYINTDGYYISLSFSKGFSDLFNFNLTAYVDIQKSDIPNFHKDQIVKVDGYIDRVDDVGLLGLSPYIENATVEIIE